MPHRRWMAVALLAWASGCGASAAGAAAPAPSDGPALEAIRRANASGANEDADAVYDLALANEEVQEASALVETGHMEEARALFSRAEEHANEAARLGSAHHVAPSLGTPGPRRP